ncbi:MAG: ABC transporter permease [Lachnospiraceae bacterium]|nr:ABC transporter permease [Lachnospiraceae bacterium]
MEHYTDLAFRYIKMNKRRSVLTILGVAVAATLLYALLNLLWSYLLNYRDWLRETKDYEIIVFTEGADRTDDLNGAWSEEAADIKENDNYVDNGNNKDDNNIEAAEENAGDNTDDSVALIDKILNDPRIKDGTVADYYKYDYYNPVTYKNSLYLNTTNPYRMEEILDGLKNDYGVDGILHKEMASTYIQGDEGEFIYVMILASFFVAYIVSLFAVGLIRNSIQLTMLERIKDFGQIRCIGATKGQLRLLVYIQGAYLELAGILMGTLTGVVVSLILGAVFGWKHTGFHALPFALVLAAFLFDLYFAMGDNAKLVSNMTPVSAIRGEYRIKKERIKRRSSRLFGKLFGLEGDYAYKSIRRNTGRFLRTISAMTLGVSAAIIIFGVVQSMKAINDTQEGQYGYYHIYYERPLMPWETISDLINAAPPNELLDKIGGLWGLSESKLSYIGLVPTADWYDDVISHYTDDFLTAYVEEEYVGELRDFIDEMRQSEEEGYIDYSFETAFLPLCGYDEEDMARYEKHLIDGNLPTKDNGIMMVVDNYVDIVREESFSTNTVFMNFSDYKVGDTIKIINIPRYRSLVGERTAPITEKYEEEDKRLEDAIKEAKKNDDMELWEELDDKRTKLGYKYDNDIRDARKECYKKLVEEKDYKEYVIEGILSGDVNRGRMLSKAMESSIVDASGPFMTLIVPRQEYFEIMGIDKQWVSGMRYHFRTLSTAQLFDVDDGGYYSGKMSGVNAGPVPSFYELMYNYMYEREYDTSAYPIWLQFKQRVAGILMGAGLLVFFIVVMTMFNTLNAASSNLYMRRKELAQLRVLGVTKKGLFKMVMLEGVIESIIACVLGIIIGTIVSIAIFYGLLVVFVSIDYSFPWLGALLSVVCTVLILCGAVYVPLKQMPTDVAADLMTAGE